MDEYIKLFQNHTLYEAYKNSADYIRPNVSYCLDLDEVHYNYEIPNNIITYKASAKLTETTSNKSSGSLNTTKFNTSIVSHTFENGVGTIEFEEDVTAIYNCAFASTNITEIQLPNTLVSIGMDSFQGFGAFSNCRSLTNITIPNSVTSIGQNAFGSCVGLTEITISNSVTSIGNTVFYGCSGLTSVTIPDSVTSIGGSAFQYCSSLTTITIPDNVTSIDNTAFRDCSSLENIVVNSGNTVYDSRNNCNAIIYTATNTLIQGCKNTVIPNNVTSIGNHAFSGSGLTSITIPNNVTNIGRDAFSNCESLISVIIPNSIISIDFNTFTNCLNLTSVTIPNSVTSIGDNAFYSCYGLLSVTIPNSVTSIGDNAFQYCSRLSSITVEVITPPTIGYSTFSNTNCPIYVPAASVDTYKAATNWSNYASRIQAIQ